MTALVSIIIPCYNAAPWIAATLESARAQTWPHVETIVIDDGSTDDSLAIAKQFAGHNLRVLAQANAGAAAARNHGLREACGDYIQFLDADDLLAPDKIERQVIALQASSNRLVAAGPWGRFTGAPESAVFTPEENWRDSSNVEWLCHNFSGRGMMPPAAWLTPREIVNQAGPWDETLSLNDDGEYFCRVLLASHGVHFVAEARSYYRSGLASSLSRTRSQRAWDSALRSQKSSAHHLLKAEDSPRTRRACADMFARLAYAMYPDCPDMVTQSETLVAQYGGSNLKPEGGIGFRITASLLGWKQARRLQSWLGKRPQ